MERKKVTLQKNHSYIPILYRFLHPFHINGKYKEHRYYIKDIIRIQTEKAKLISGNTRKTERYRSLDS